ncbi:acuF, partial [Symbiodinium sp. CCMP2592]
DISRDRLILDGRAPNTHELPLSSWTQALACAEKVGQIFLEDDEKLIASGRDLRDFFYQFKVSRERTARNCLAGALCHDDLRLIFGDVPNLPVFRLEELNTLNTPVPRSPVHIGVIIDDLIVLERIAIGTNVAGELRQQTESDVRMSRADKAYEGAQLLTNASKAFQCEESAKFWGIELDGVKGVVRPARARLWALIAVTVRVACLGFGTVGLLKALCGSWTSIALLRRRMLSVINLLFAAADAGDPNDIVKFSGELKSELWALALIGPAIAIDIRAKPADYIIATDASSWGGAAGDFLVPNELASVLATSLVYHERWRKGFRRAEHINCKELRAYLLEEYYVARNEASIRLLAGIDSQVALGSLCKGRASSEALNRHLSASLGPYLGAGIYPHYMYFLSAENPSDGPTRGKPPPPPSRPKPMWWSSLSSGDYGEFDAWIARLPGSKPGPDFSHLRPKVVVDTTSGAGARAELRGAYAAHGADVCPAPTLATSGSTVERDWDLFGVPGLQFQWGGKGSRPDWNRGGALDLFSGSRGLTRALLRNGAPWVITYDIRDSPDQDLLDPCVRQTVEDLVTSGRVRGVGMSPPGCSFSAAVTPRIRNVRHPCVTCAILERPGGKELVWLPTSSFGDSAIAVAVREDGAWDLDPSRRRLDIPGCARALGYRIGEAKKPGPRRRISKRTGSLDSQPLQTAATLQYEDRLWALFLSWSSVCLSDPCLVFSLYPALAAMALREFRNYSYCAGRTLSSYRHTIIAVQRRVFGAKPFLNLAWEMVSRWEAIEPPTHRCPIPEPMVKAMCFLGRQWGLPRWCGITLLAFYGLARIGEVMKCTKADLLLPSDLMEDVGCVAYLNFRESKTALRGRPKVQHTKVVDPAAVSWLIDVFSELQPHDLLWPASPAAYRYGWDKLLRHLGVGPELGLTPGGLRGGGAVQRYRAGHSPTDLQWTMRLKHLGTLEHYLQELAAVTALTQVDSSSRSRIRTAAKLFEALSDQLASS